MKYMRGVVDPYTLGFLLAIFGGLTLGPAIENSHESSESKAQTTISVNEQDSETNL